MNSAEIVVCEMKNTRGDTAGMEFRTKAKSLTKPPWYELRFTSAARKARALRRLGVSAEQLACAPQVTQLLNDTKLGRQSILAALRLSQDPAIRTFLAKHDSLPVWDRQNVAWEAIAIAAGVSPQSLVGAALFALGERGMMGFKRAMRPKSYSCWDDMLFVLLPQKSKAASDPNTKNGETPEFRPNDKAEIARRFKALRSRVRHFTQRDLGRVIGIGRQAVSRIERQQVMPHCSTWNRFAAVEARNNQPKITLPVHWR